MQRACHFANPAHFWAVAMHNPYQRNFVVRRPTAWAGERPAGLLDLEYELALVKHR